MFCLRFDELHRLIILVQVLYSNNCKVRKGQAWTSWLDACLPSRETQHRNLCLTSPRLPLLNQLQTHLSAAADWPSLRRTKSPTGGQRCWVSVISRPGEICCLVHLLFNGIGALLSQGCTPICLANFTVTTDGLFPSLLCVFAKRDSIAKYIKPLDLVKCRLKCLLALGQQNNC